MGGVAAGLSYCVFFQLSPRYQAKTPVPHSLITTATNHHESLSSIINHYQPSLNMPVVIHLFFMAHNDSQDTSGLDLLIDTLAEWDPLVVCVLWWQ